jgi:hypothetical protein
MTMATIYTGVITFFTQHPPLDFCWSMPGNYATQGIEKFCYITLN